MPDEVSIKYNPPDLIARMGDYPATLDYEMRQGVEMAIIVLQESVPAYPPQPIGSSYKRTGTLGRSLGSAQSGGKIGSPSINVIRKLGRGDYEGKMGTSLSYAPDVIGTSSQLPRFGYWWKMIDVAERARGKITKVFDTVAGRMASFLEGR